MVMDNFDVNRMKKNTFLQVPVIFYHQTDLLAQKEFQELLLKAIDCDKTATL